MGADLVFDIICTVIIWNIGIHWGILEVRREAIKQNKAIYHPTTGKFQWK